MGICARCLENGELCISHAIPNAFFKSLLREGSGKAIEIPSGNGIVKHGNQSGGAELLCAECEHYFAENFDRLFVQVFRKLDRKVITDPTASVEAHHGRLARAIASILWRAVLLKSEFYKSVRLPNEQLADLVHIFTGNDDEALSKCSLQVLRVIDPSEGGLSQDAISQMILNVEVLQGKRSPKKPFTWMISFAVQGFLFHFFLPRESPARRRKGFLKPKGRRLVVPCTNFRDDPWMIEATRLLYHKHSTGQVSNLLKERNS